MDPPVHRTEKPHLDGCVQGYSGASGSIFSKGSNHLVPLRMTDIADRLGIHESTVSRAVSHKYLQCSWGVYP
mgnify:CR=1 FL=1